MDPFSSPSIFTLPGIQEAEDDFMQHTLTFLKKFFSLWRQFGLDEDCIAARSGQVWGHVRTLLVDIYTEDYDSYEKVLRRIKTHKTAIDRLSKLLQVEQMDCSEEPLFKREKELRQELQRLSALKRERLEVFSKLKVEESQLRRSMLMEVETTACGPKVPLEADIQRLSQQVSQLRMEQERRFNVLKETRKELAGIIERGEWAPESAFEKDILSKQGFLLSREAMELLESTMAKARKRKEEMKMKRKELEGKLERLRNSLNVEEHERIAFLDCCVGTLEEEVKRLEEVRWRKRRPMVEALKRELEDLWDKCHVPETDRCQFQSRQLSEVTGEMLEAYEDEVAHWRRRYEDTSALLDKIARRQHLWDEMIALETNSANPERFRNRRGNLLVEEKERKRLQKSLPALEEEIFKDIEEYERRASAAFRYCGGDYRVFVSEQWALRLNRKEFEKVERRRQRSLESVPSQGLGSTPTGTTPRKVSRSSGSSGTPLGSSHTPNRMNAPIVGPLFSPSLAQKNGRQNKGKMGPSNGGLFSPRPLQKEDVKPCTTESPNGTTYTVFAEGLDRTDVHSSLLERNSSRRGRGVKGKKVGILRKSARNVSKTTTKLTPKRGKLGLPFLI